MQREYAKVLHEGLIVFVLLYINETIIWREKDKFRIRIMQMDNLRGFLGIRRMDRVPNVRIRESCGEDERIEKSIFRWFGHIERMENDRIAKRVYVGECVSSCLVEMD